MSTQNEAADVAAEELVNFLYHTVFIPDWELSGNPKCIPQKVGPMMIITDARILIELPFSKVHFWREQVGEDFNWHEGDKPISKDKKHWLALDAILEKFFQNTTCYPIPLATKPEDVPDTWLTFIDCDLCSGAGRLYGHYCPECGGNRKFQDLHPAASEGVAIEGSYYSRRFIWILNALPNSKFVNLDRSATSAPQAASFVFDGGRGVLMPFRNSMPRSGD